jgi:hypothetical protein
VTSLERAGGSPASMDAVMDRLALHVAEVFGRHASRA